MNTFTLKIEMGNDAMQKRHHVQAALYEVAELLDDTNCINDGPSGVIRDANGNTVGHWRFT
jgi:hypothetical protein